MRRFPMTMFTFFLFWSKNFCAYAVLFCYSVSNDFDGLAFNIAYNISLKITTINYILYLQKKGRKARKLVSI
jgi:hypothetical protein